MSETTAGDVNGPVLSGSFTGPVVMESTPRTPAEFAKAAWLLMLSDQADRTVRWRETDEHRAAVTKRLNEIDVDVKRALWMSGAGLGGVCILAGRMLGWW